MNDENSKNIVEELLNFFSEDDWKQNGDKILQEREKIVKFLESKTERTMYENGIELARKIGALHRKEFPVNKLIIDRLIKYEESVLNILPEHRDHFIHSIFVYLLGIYLYRKSKLFVKPLGENMLKNDMNFKWLKEQRSEHLASKKSDSDIDKEFIFRWRMISLFHDVAYPLEISAKLMRKYSKEVLLSYESSCVESARNLIEYSIPDLENLFYIGVIPGYYEEKREFAWDIAQETDVIDFISKRLVISSVFSYPNADSKLLSHRIKESFVKSLKEGFVDHGVFSATIFLKWMANLYRENRNWNSEQFYTSIVEIAKAIALHTMHRRLYSPIVKIDINQAPLAYLLILCDELQEWYRRSGKSKKKAPHNIMKQIKSYKMECQGNRIYFEITGDPSKKKKIEKQNKKIKGKIKELLTPYILC